MVYAFPIIANLFVFPGWVPLTSSNCHFQLFLNTLSPNKFHATPMLAFQSQQVTTSPILATTMSPFLISLAGTIISVPSFFSHTLLILSDILRAKSPTDFLCVHSSKSSPTPNRTALYYLQCTPLIFKGRNTQFMFN